MANVIDELCSLDSSLPAQVHENRKTLAKQIARLADANDE
jgi:hypothetical protein